MHEPDSDRNEPFGLLAKAGLGRLPLARDADDLPLYERLWRSATEGGRPTRSLRDRLGRLALRATTLDLRNEVLRGEPTARARTLLRALQLLAAPLDAKPVATTLVIKSVHCALAMDFIVSRVGVDVVVIRRDPLNAVASWLDLGWRPLSLGNSELQNAAIASRTGVEAPGEHAPLDVHHAWLYCALMRALMDQVERHPEWLVVDHDELCRDPLGEFRRLYSRLDLEWTPTVERKLRASDAPGVGYETKRIMARQPDAWRSRLRPIQARRIARVSERFGLSAEHL